MKAEVLIGVSASGKTTYATTLEGYTTISRDDIRFGIVAKGGNWTNYKFSKENENKVTEIQQQMIEDCAKHGENVVIADTNLNPSVRQKMVEKLRDCGYEVSFVMFQVSKANCIERDSYRGAFSVGEDVIEKQWESWERTVRGMKLEKKRLGVSVVYLEN